MPRPATARRPRPRHLTLRDVFWRAVEGDDACVGAPIAAPWRGGAL